MMAFILMFRIEKFSTTLYGEVESQYDKYEDGNNTSNRSTRSTGSSAWEKLLSQASFLRNEVVHHSLTSGSLNPLAGMEPQPVMSVAHNQVYAAPPYLSAEPRLYQDAEVQVDFLSSVRESQSEDLKLDLQNMLEYQITGSVSGEARESTGGVDSNMLNISVSDFLDKDKKKSNKEGSPGKIETFVMFPIKTCNKYTSTEDLIIKKKICYEDHDSIKIKPKLDKALTSPTQFAVEVNVEDITTQIKKADNPILCMYEAFKTVLPESVRVRLLSTATVDIGAHVSMKISKLFGTTSSELQYLRGQIAGVELELAKSEGLSQSLSVLAGLTEGDIHSYKKSFEDMFRCVERADYPLCIYCSDLRSLQYYRTYDCSDLSG